MSSAVALGAWRDRTNLYVFADPYSPNEHDTDLQQLHIIPSKLYPSSGQTHAFYRSQQWPLHR